MFEVGCASVRTRLHSYERQGSVQGGSVDAEPACDLGLGHSGLD